MIPLHILLKMNKNIYQFQGAKMLQKFWVGFLSDKSYAVILLNRGIVKAKMAANLKKIGLPACDDVVRDLWVYKFSVYYFVNCF